MIVGGQCRDPTNLPPGKRLVTHFTEGYLGRRAGVDGCGKNRRLLESIPEPPSQYPVAMPTELSWFIYILYKYIA